MGRYLQENEAGVLLEEIVRMLKKEEEKILKKFKQLLLLVIMLSCAAIWMQSEQVNAQVKRSVDPNAGEDGKAPYQVVQQVLDEARENATASNPYTITIKAGKYNIEQALKLYSNTVLKLDGVTLYASGDSSLLKVGEAYDTAQGYAYKNITVEGGVLDMKEQNHTAFKIAHAATVSVKNMTIKNAGGHCIEAAGVDGLKLQGCVFRDQTITGKKTYESVQLDIMSSKHIVGYTDQLELQTKNVTVSKCTFQNVPRGIGSHTAVFGVPFSNITIKNCKFKDMKSAAIQTMNWKNATISNNTIEAPRGIAVYRYTDRGVYRASGVSSDKTKDAGIVISKNKITCKGKDAFANYTPVGISLNGYHLTSTQADKDSGQKISKNNYVLTGVKLVSNTVNMKGNGMGIRILDSQSVKVSKNKVSQATYGIQVSEGSKKVNADGNTVENCSDIGIYYNGSSSSSKITGNHTIKCSRGSVSFDATCKGISVSNNKAD